MSEVRSVENVAWSCKCGYQNTTYVCTKCGEPKSNTVDVTDSIRECIGDSARDLQAAANAELSALLRDARRYRYLRNQGGMPTPEAFDAAIDADMTMLAEGGL